jgi:hypothetical protein
VEDPPPRGCGHLLLKYRRQNFFPKDEGIINPRLMATNAMRSATTLQAMQNEKKAEKTLRSSTQDSTAHATPRGAAMITHHRTHAFPKAQKYMYSPRNTNALISKIIIALGT